MHFPLGRDAGRCSVIVSSAAQMSRVRATPGVLRVFPITERVASVRSVPSDRDRAMESLRSLRPAVVALHACRPRGTRGALHQITERIILRVLKGYDPSTFHVQVTRSAGASPVKVANAERSGRYAHSRSEWFGFGNVNAARAVAEAVRLKAAGRAG